MTRPGRLARARPPRAAERPLPPLVMLRAFEATGRMGTMRKAADDIGVSHTVISRHVRNLEAWIGRKLVAAGPRGAVLTKDGEAFFSVVSKAFKMIGMAAVELRPLGRHHTLRIACVPGLATRWLIPRLSIVQGTLNDTEVVLRAIDQYANLANSDADVMISFGDFGELPEGAIPLLRPRVFPVASSEWLARVGFPSSVADLINFPLIHEENRRRWAAWFEAAGVKLERPLTGPRLWDANLRFDAVLAGQGIALDVGLTTTEEISRGRMVELFDTNIRLGGYYLQARQDRGNGSLVARFREWLQVSLTASDLEANKRTGVGQVGAV